MSFGPPPTMQPPQGAPPSRPGGREGRARGGRARGGRARQALLGLLVLVLAGVLGTGGWLLWQGPSGGGQDTGKPGPADGPGRLDVRETVEKRPASTTGEMAFRFSADDMAPGEHNEMPGMWATDRILAKGIKRTLVGYRIGTDAEVGDEAWRTRLGGWICGYTRHVTGENRTAVLFRENDEEDSLCNHVAFVDLDDGREVWQHEFLVSGAGPSQSTPEDAGVQDRPSVTLTHGTVAVTWGGGTVGYAMDGGEKRWRTTVAGRCQDMGAAGGRALLVREQCWTADDDAGAEYWQRISYHLRKVDPATGRTLWSYEAPKGIRDLSVPSTDPAVIAVPGGETGITELISLDDEGKNRATLRLGDGTYVGECFHGDYVVIDYCPTIAVGAGQAFLRSKDQPEKQISNWVIGFDLATGNTTTKFDSGPGALLYPLRTSGDQLLALRLSDDGITPNALVGLDPGTGRQTPWLYFALPAEAELLSTPHANDVLVQDGRLFFGARAAIGPGGTAKQWTYLVLGIGSGAAEKP
ncbi:PQQ-binding-like beta-propeller repeat protein [Streptomyces sp. HMX87]|uniref:outer membrane protein assembly factor BamB family protein n=1 Tax=Streptomyces sp. HMX87 TaxID=3390849 RepID=UPI003A83BAD2